jgi:hypothetical protein
MPAMALLFPTDLRGIPNNAGPRSLAIPGSSSRELDSLSRVRSRSSPARRPQTPSTSPGVTVSPSRHQLEESTNGQLPKANLTFRPQRFSRSRRVTPLQALVAYFIRLPRPRLTLQGFAPTISRADSSPVRSLMMFATFSCGRVAPTAPGPAVHLQGFNPTAGPL